MCVTVLKCVCAVFWLIDEPSSHSIPGIFGIFPVLLHFDYNNESFHYITTNKMNVCVCVCMQICISTDWDWWSVQKRQKMAVMSNMFNTDNSQNSSVSVCAVEGTVSSCALNCNWAAGLYEAAINLSLLC